MKDNQYKHLLSPMIVRGQVFKNRILCGPLGYNQVNLSAAMSQENIDYYGALARGGAARIITGDCMVSDDAGYFGGGGRPKWYAPPMEMMNSAKTFVKTIHQYDSLAFVQLGYNGADYVGGMGGETGTGSAVSYGPDAADFGTSKVIAMDQDKINEVIGHFVHCVANLRMAGVDGICIHGGHGNKILDLFRSPRHNHRTDKYGGSVEKRCTFALELLRAVRKAAGPDMILELRFSAEEIDKDGIQLEDTITYLKLLEAEHLVDIFHCSAGMHITPYHNAYVTSPGTMPRAPLRKYAKAIKAAGLKTPLALVNSVADPDVAEDIIISGDADFLVMARQICLADPYYPRKLREGKPWLIDNCLRCHGCYDMVGPCSVNPYASYKTYESSYELPEAKTKRKICIVGGGISGMKAAWTAAERGHHVILFEKENALGGQLRFADTDTLKLDIRRYKQSMEKRVMTHPNIEVRLNTTVTPERIQAEMPCSLIVSIGAEQKIPDMPGIHKQNVMTIMDTYLHPERVGKRVVMMGSGLTACEVGMHLSNLDKQVTIVGRRDVICYHEDFHHMPTAMFSPIPKFMEWIDEHHMGLYLNTDVVEVLDEGVRVRDVKTGVESILEADTVVICAGSAARRMEALRYNDCGADYFAMTGDCIKAHKIREAVSTGFWAAMEV